MRGFSAKLSDGRVLKEWDIARSDRPGWFILKDILEKEKVKIVELVLEFDHQRVNTRNNAPTYFYAKKVEAWMDLDLPQKHFYGIGAQERPGSVDITWYDGENGFQETRTIDKNDFGILINA